MESAILHDINVLVTMVTVDMTKDMDSLILQTFHVVVTMVYINSPVIWSLLASMT